MIVIWIMLMLVGFVALVASRIWASYSPACIAGPSDIKLCVASDAQKIGLNLKVAAEPSIFDPDEPLITLFGARNEVLGFQVILRGVTVAQPTQVIVSDLTSDNGGRIEAESAVERFFAFYHWVDPGGYSWGTPSKVLEWPHHYPDALIPLQPLCPGGPPRAGGIPVIYKKDRLVWIDIYIPQSAGPGIYRGEISITLGQESQSIPLEIEVYSSTLPDENHVHALGELYGAYRQEGVRMGLGSPEWQRMAQCYQQLAHRHRMVFAERLNDVVWPGETEDWESYLNVFGPALDGSLFTAARGYIGPGEGIPVSTWRVPWPQNIDLRVRRPLEQERIDRMRRFAEAWAGQIKERGWDRSYFFAYIFDEVDGPTDEEPASDQRRRYVQMAHEQMYRVQHALDLGAGEPLIDLMWTSHTNPFDWYGDNELDLTGIIRLWCPNASAADVDFLRMRALAGEQVWFYHSGHPHVGIHAINASGIEMRTWGVIAARYALNGQFMWALDFGSKDEPYRMPSYKSGDDRFGNGTFVYPGNMLHTIGFQAQPGPVPSIRLKAWRRGLQDFELIRLARLAGHENEVEKLVREIMPRALSEGRDRAAWSDDPEIWHRFHRRLLTLASG